MNTEKIFEKALDDARKILKNPVSEVGCPLDEVLVDFVYDDLISEERPLVSSHIKECVRCHLMILKLEADRYGWEQAFDSDPDATLVHALGDVGFKSVLEGLKSRKVKNEESIPSVSDIKISLKKYLEGINKNLIGMISSIWRPEWAGELVTAADIRKQTKTLNLDEGIVMLSCSWGTEDDHGPAFLTVSWRVDVEGSFEIWALFLDPDKETIFSEIYLGTSYEGEELFTTKMLNFDPSVQNWAIAIVLKKKHK